MSKRIKSALPLLSGNAVILFLLLAGGLFSFTTAYALTPNTPALLAGCCVLSLLFTVLWFVPRGGWVALGLLGLDALAIWKLWDRLEPAVTFTKMAITGSEWREPLAYGLMKNHAAGVLTPALLLLAVGLAVVLSWLAVRERCWHLPAVLVTIPLIPAFLSGTLPHLLPLTASAAGWGTLLLTGLYNRRDKDSLGKGIWIGLGGISALLLLLLAALPQEGYTRPAWATNARWELIDAVNQGFSSFWADGGGEGNPWNLDFGFSVSSSKEVDGQVDLTKTGPRRYSNQTVLQIIGGAPGRTYLRGGSSAHYTGSGWEPLSDSERKEFIYPPAMFPALTAPVETPSETLTVKHVRGKGDIAYVPYRYFAFPDGMAYLSGDGDAVRSMDEYQIEYIPGGPLGAAFIPLSDELKQVEQLYRDFVHRHYLDVPEETEQALMQVINDLNRADGVVLPEYPAELPGQYQADAFTALLAAETLARLAVYDLDVPQMEPGEDFVAHFLEEGRGYCVHFATAGAMLLRLYGIPARYVEGYAPLLRDGVTSVRDSDAHAWVEIYLDGYGWYPVEMTPGRQGETPDTASPEILQTESPIVPPEEEDPEEKTPEEEEQDVSQAETPEDKEETAGEDTPEQEPVDFRWFWRTAAVVLAVAAVYGGYRLMLLVQKRRREHPDTNRSVIYAYLRCQWFVKRDVPEEPELEELGRKAKFSQHQMTEEERAAAWRCADHAAEEWKKKWKISCKNGRISSK